MIKYKKITLLISIFSYFIFPSLNAYSAASTDPTKYYFSGVNYDSTIKRTAWGATSEDIGKSTVVLSAASNYNRTDNIGFERGRIWSREDIVKGHMLSPGETLLRIRTLRAEVNFENSIKNGNLWIDGSDPAQTVSTTGPVPQWTFELLQLSTGTVGTVANVASWINGFTSASTTVGFPNNDRQKHRVEYYNSSGLSQMNLPASVGYKDADYYSRDKYLAASPRWKFSLTNKSAYNYGVKVSGRVLYETYKYDGLGTYYYDYAWSGTATVEHQINRL